MKDYIVLSETKHVSDFFICATKVKTLGREKSKHLYMSSDRICIVGGNHPAQGLDQTPKVWVQDDLTKKNLKTVEKLSESNFNGCN